MDQALVLALLIPVEVMGGTPITGISFDLSTVRNTAPGNGASAPESDNWTITWADDGHQYTSFGDGQGFSTFDTTRASFGFARIEGDKDNYGAFDVSKHGAGASALDGKCLGIISIDGTLYMFRNGTGSGKGAFERTELYQSIDNAQTVTFTGVAWRNNPGFFSPTFLQFGQDYQGARDNFVYIYANERTTSVGQDWEVQVPGRISLFRVDKNEITDQAAYEYFAGRDASGNPQWSPDIGDRAPVFEDSANGSMRTSVSHNAGLDRYILVTQQVSRFEADDYHIGIYEAPEPWGPWSTVLFDNPKSIGINDGHKTVYWNFANKWLSEDGRSFVMVYTGPGPDEWGTVEGTFLTGDVKIPRPPSNVQVLPPGL